MSRRAILWLIAVLLALPVVVLALVTIFGVNWARGPLERAVADKTGRELRIRGDLTIRPAWPAPRLRALTVSFANPPWAQEKQMIAADEVEFSIDLYALMRKQLAFPEVRLTRPVVYLERAADGRKTWLLDREQVDEGARIPIGRLTLDRGLIGYDDAGQKTAIRADVSTGDGTSAVAKGEDVTFKATGTYKGNRLTARGSGGSVLALYDETEPYRLKVEAKVGETGIEADGTVTSLFKLVAMDMRVVLSGVSLAQLYPLVGVALPETNPYVLKGRMLRSGKTWRFDGFSGRIGKSDVAGSLAVDLGGVRPFMHGDLTSQLLDPGDLGPPIGVVTKAGATRKAASGSAPRKVGETGARMLPDLPFDTARWGSADADVRLRAQALRRAGKLPLENLVGHITMRDSQLTLDPLDFGVAGGHLKAVISLDGRRDPIQARARVSARKIRVAALFPEVDPTASSVAQINGEFDLTGHGNSVGRMLAGADGRASLVVGKGEISKLMMERIGLHLLEILEIKITGDRTVKLNCAVADFRLAKGVMHANALVLDSEISTITGSGSIDLSNETLDLTLVPKSRALSLIALRSPIHVHGSFSHPEVDIDKGRIAARGLGAIALGLINPFLALIPLIETGPGNASECANLIRAAQSPPARKSEAGTRKAAAR